jgi:hypothetical protein
MELYANVQVQTHFYTTYLIQVQCAGYVAGGGGDAYRFIKLVLCPCKSSIQTGPENPVTIWQGYLCSNTPGLSSLKLSKSCSLKAFPRLILEILS